MEKGENLNAMMPYLSKYLGHSSVENTYYYYHQIESAFKIVRQRMNYQSISFRRWHIMNQLNKSLFFSKTNDFKYLLANAGNEKK